MNFGNVGFSERDVNIRHSEPFRLWIAVITLWNDLGFDLDWIWQQHWIRLINSGSLILAPQNPIFNFVLCFPVFFRFSFSSREWKRQNHSNSISLLSIAGAFNH